jgi:hypothetical protein
MVDGFGEIGEVDMGVGVDQGENGYMVYDWVRPTKYPKID